MPKKKAKPIIRKRKKAPPTVPSRKRKDSEDSDEGDSAEDDEDEDDEDEDDEINDNKKHKNSEEEESDELAAEDKADEGEEEQHHEEEEEEDQQHDWSNFERMKKIREGSNVVMKAMVRGSVNRVVWAKLKFIVLPEKQLEFGGKVAKVVMEDLQIVPRDRRRFWEENREQVIGALSKKRNNICKDLKTKLMKDIENGK